MVTQRTFARRIGFYWPCMAPSIILSDEHLKEEDGTVLPSLRDEASSEGLCYFRVLRSFYDGTYLAHVAASLELLDEHPCIVIFSEKQLYHAFPYDCRTQARLRQEQYDSVRTLLHEHAQEVCPAVRCTPEQPRQPQPELVELLLEKVLEVPVEIAHDDLPSGLLADVVDTQTFRESALQVQDALAVQRAVLDRISQRISTFSMQQTFIQTLIDTLVNKFWTTCWKREPARARALRTCCKLVAQVQHWHQEYRQPVMQATPIFHEDHVTWSLRIGIPWISPQAA